jgi:uroporphyrinogen decarboxylase
MYSQVYSSLDRAGEAEFEQYISRLEQIQHRPEDYNLDELDLWLQGSRNLFVLMGADVDFPPASKSWASRFMEWLILRPDLVDRYIAAQMPSRLVLMEIAFQRGVDGVLAGNDWASAAGPLISLKHYRRFILPHFRQISDLCHRYKKVLVKHTDGNIRLLENFMFDECGIDGWHPVDPSAGLSMADYKRRYGERITLIGNINCATTLVEGTPDQVRLETLTTIHAAAPGGRFILSSSNSIHSGVQAELYAVMLETAKQNGTYPIYERNCE